jgi:hypothetical protein
MLARPPTRRAPKTPAVPDSLAVARIADGGVVRRNERIGEPELVGHRDERAERRVEQEKIVLVVGRVAVLGRVRGGQVKLAVRPDR